jgi:hypothetical protein
MLFNNPVWISTFIDKNVDKERDCRIAAAGIEMEISGPGGKCQSCSYRHC